MNPHDTGPDPYTPSCSRAASRRRHHSLLRARSRAAPRPRRAVRRDAAAARADDGPLVARCTLLRTRWERAGWARGRALLVGEPVFVWLTRRGQSLDGIDYSVWRPNAGMLTH